MIEIHLSDDRKSVAVCWGRGPFKILHEDGTVTERYMIRGERVWCTSEPGYEAGLASGYEGGFADGYDKGYAEGEKAARKSKAS